MHTLRRFIHQHATRSLLALLVALLWSVGWGQVHRVLHPGTGTSLAVRADSPTPATGLAHEDGSSLCHLLDHLSDGAGPVQAVAALAAAPLPAAKPLLSVARLHVPALRGFEARGPPALT